MSKEVDAWSRLIGGRYVGFAINEEADGRYRVTAAIVETRQTRFFDERPTRPEVEEHFKSREDFRSRYKQPE